MVFSSLNFIFVFLPLLLIVYMAVSKKYKNLVLLIAGLIFYAWGEPVYLWVMLVSSLVDFSAGIYIGKSDNQKKRRLVLILSMIVDLGFLFVFKYSGFAVRTFNSIFGSDITPPDLPLPIGISFYTFQSMSYTIDVYLKKVKTQKNFINYLTYVSLFPQLVAGPIVRYDDVAEEIESRSVNADKFGEGAGYFIKGLGKKVLLANNVGMLWTSIKGMDLSEISVLTAWLGILAYTFQIYYDFSGYSDMAIGLGKMFGFDFPVNFDHPYQSASITEFWRRWHITLGAWFRTYVYIPLGGNRKGKFKMYRNLAIVWLLTGFWHGASFNFIIWGAFYGFLIIIEKAGFLKILEKMPLIVSRVYTFVLVMIGWVFFDTENLSQAGQYLKAMFAGNGLSDSLSLYQLRSYIIILLICAVGSTELLKKTAGKISGIKKMEKASCLLVPVLQICIFLLCVCFLVDPSYNPFLYFRF